jgi:hypothetical protein
VPVVHKAPDHDSVNHAALSSPDIVAHLLRRGDGLALPLRTLAARQVKLLAAHDRRRLLNNLLALGQDELDVARVGHYARCQHLPI